MASGSRGSPVRTIGREDGLPRPWVIRRSHTSVQVGVTRPRTRWRAVLPSISLCLSDDRLLKTLITELQIHGFHVEPHASASAAMETPPGATPWVWVLDVALPDADGRDVCRALRAA